MDSISVEKEAIEKMKGCGDLHKTIKLVPSDAEERKRQVHVLWLQVYLTYPKLSKDILIPRLDINVVQKKTP